MRLTSVYIHVSTVVVVQLISCIQLFATLWTVTHQTSLPMGFPRQEYWSGLPFLLQGLSPPGTELVSPVSPALADGIFTTAPPGKSV